MKSNRRSFIKKSAFGFAGAAIGGMGMTARSYGNITGANDRINVAIVGLGRRLGDLFEPFWRKESNVQLMYLCDVMESQRIKAAGRFSEGLDYSPRLENDVRRIYEDKSVDAIFDLSPDHWHAPGTCFAVQAGKHVYVEKPCSHNPREGELLVEFQKKYGKLIQMGNQQVSSPETIEILGEIHKGVIGVPYKAIAFYSNARGEVPVPVKAPIPDGLDWDLFQGPAPREEYRHDTWNYNWHWYGWKWGTAESGNNAVHELALARLALQVGFPERVDVAAGKNHFPEDGWTMYDSMDATFTFPGNKVIKWDGKSRNRYNTYGSPRGTIIFGSEGTVFLTIREGGGYQIFDRGGNLVREQWTATNKAVTPLGGVDDMSARHIGNFFDAIRGKARLNSPIAEGVKSTHLCHLANIAYRTGKGFYVNPSSGQALDRDALRLWSREYEPGWEPRI